MTLENVVVFPTVPFIPRLVFVTTLALRSVVSLNIVSLVTRLVTRTENVIIVPICHQLVAAKVIIVEPVSLPKLLSKISHNDKMLMKQPKEYPLKPGGKSTTSNFLYHIAYQNINEYIVNLSFPDFIIIKEGCKVLILSPYSCIRSWK